MPNEHPATTVVVRTYLELPSPAALRPTPPFGGNARIVRRNPCPRADYRRLYAAVGGPWHWRDRLAWDDATLDAHLASPDIAIWELVISDESAGYFELRHSATDEVEIAYFGLGPAFIGRGLGGALLSAAVEEAWRFGGKRVWLHTCTLDSPHALPNYKARGFRPYRTEQYEVQLS